MSRPKVRERNRREAKERASNGFVLACMRGDESACMSYQVELWEEYNKCSFTIDGPDDLRPMRFLKGRR